MPGIVFGTDGWRSIIAEEFTFDNVRVVTQAIAGHLLAQNGDKRGAVVGYDRRFLSEHFAAAVAEVLAGNGIPVYLTDGDVPTPVVAFAVKHYQAAGAVMLTASHNPPQYNGIKFIPDYGGPAMPDVTNAIEQGVQQVAKSRAIERLSLEAAKEQGMVQLIAPGPDYLAHLRQLLDLQAIARADLRLVVDPMYGAGSGYLETLLGEAGCRVEAIHQQRDPLFGGRLPEPVEANLPELIGRVQASGSQLGLALDGDADRFGIVDAGGIFLSANQVLSLVLYHLLERRGWGREGMVARTVATTHLLDRIADYYGLTVRETPVGFKYIGHALRELQAVMGGEESGGMSIRGHLPEKDGILTAALMTEVVATERKTLTAVLHDLAQRFGPLASRRLDLHVSQTQKDRILNLLPVFQPVKVAGLPVVERLTIDGIKLVLSDGSWLLIRPSGTEPLLRLYVEAGDETQLALIQREVLADLGL